MGNCNFKTDKDKETVAGKFPKALEMILTGQTHFYSLIKEPVPVSIRDRAGRIRQSVASGT